MKLVTDSRFNEPSKHKYIALIEFSLKQPSFSADDVYIATGLSEKEFRFIIDSIFIPNGYQTQPVFDHEKKQEWVLRPEAYFSYLQYLEFCHSIKNSKQSYWMAVVAIVVSLIGVSLSIFK
jgi:hypothetical protein